MGRIGKTYPRHDSVQPLVVPAASGGLIFVPKGLGRRFPGFLWLTAFVSLLLLAWPSA
jgi:hypothetical protein